MSTTTVDPSGYMVAPLAAPIAYATIMPLWDVLHFGINLLLVLLFIQAILAVAIACFSLVISIPLLWMLRKTAQRLVLPRKLFIVLTIVLAILFSWFTFDFMYIRVASHSSLLAAMVCGVALNFLIFTRFFDTKA